MSLGVLIVAGVLIVGLCAWLFSRGSQLGRIFSDAHLIEIAEGMAGVKAAALAAANSTADEIDPATDPRVLVTSASIVIFYTMDKEAGGYSHHYSLKDQYGITTRAVGATLTLYLARLLGIAPQNLRLERSAQEVYHAGFLLSEAEQEAFAERPIVVPGPTEARALLRESMDSRETVQFEPMTET